MRWFATCGRVSGRRTRSRATSFRRWFVMFFVLCVVILSRFFCDRYIYYVCELCVCFCFCLILCLMLFRVRRVNSWMKKNLNGCGVDCVWCYNLCEIMWWWVWWFLCVCDWWCLILWVWWSEWMCVLLCEVWVLGDGDVCVIEVCDVDVGLMCFLDDVNVDWLMMFDVDE